MELIISVSLDENGAYVLTDGNDAEVFRSSDLTDALSYITEEIQAY